ncbi:hypothetical protein Trco_000630 [Trichoderma cornu-damae]|uniref:HNH nuclease domain-containing protein n=1 Tax=Trichoderma cornu-damae TaxID=654480 RepID=A0A9P8QQN5_9HYPO|nr:hypothetical protein Trco_000630 [Trichoderma cornu-damae]
MPDVSPISTPGCPEGGGADMIRTPRPRGSSRQFSLVVEPPALVTAKAGFQKSRRLLLQMNTAYEELKREVEPVLEPDQEKPEPDLTRSLELVYFGLDVAATRKVTIKWERHVLEEQRAAGLVSSADFEKRSDALDKRHLAAGDDMWRNHRKKADLTGTGARRILGIRTNNFFKILLALYVDRDGLGRRTKRAQKRWLRDCIAYYDAQRNDIEVGKGQATEKWCHVSGMWRPGKLHKAAHIVPFLLDIDTIGEILFGSRSESLLKAGNSLSLSSTIKVWFDKYFITIVPVDAKEKPLRRWRTDVISTDILNSPCGGTQLYGRDLDGKELVFRNEKRPVARFLYFHFIMSLIRIRHIKRPGWEIAWARYYDQRPFPSPGNYMRQAMLVALATYYDIGDMEVIQSWVLDHGFEEPLPMVIEEICEVSRRVHKAVHDSMAGAEEQDRNNDEMIHNTEDGESEVGDEDDGRKAFVHAMLVVDIKTRREMG